MEIKDNESRFVETLPAVYPGVRHFVWVRNKNAAALVFDAPRFKIQLRRTWTNIETIIDHCYHLDLSTHLLEISTCDQLTSIEVSFANYNTAEDTAREKLKALISTIDNAPSLEKVVFRHMPVELADMENLHRDARNLTAVKLDNVYISTDDSRASIVPHPAWNVKSFSMYASDFYAISYGDDDRSLENVMGNWITYIGVRDLILCTEQQTLGIQDTELVSGFLASALGNLKHLISYSVNLAIPSELVLNVLNENKVQLSHLMILLDPSCPIEVIFNPVITSQACLTLSSLTVDCGYDMDALDVGRGLTSLDRSLQYLTYLKVNCG